MEDLKTLALILTEIAEAKYSNATKNWSQLTPSEKLQTQWNLCFLDDCLLNKSITKDRLLTAKEASDHLRLQHSINEVDKVKRFLLIVIHKETRQLAQSAGNIDEINTGSHFLNFFYF